MEPGHHTSPDVPFLNLRAPRSRAGEREPQLSHLSREPARRRRQRVRLLVDYKDLFKSIEGAVHDCTSGALDGYGKEDVAGLLDDRLVKGKERLEEALEAVRALCEPVEPPKDDEAYYAFCSSAEHGNAEMLKANEPQRLALYKLVAALVRAYANLASEMSEAGYSATEATEINVEVTFYEHLRNQVKLHSGDAIDLKQ